MATTRRTGTSKKQKQETRSVVRADFRERYGAAGSCGDDVAARLRELTAKDDGGTDARRLRRIARANGCWRDEYAALNVGMQRMNVGNRLRKLARDGAAIKWS